MKGEKSVKNRKDKGEEHSTVSYDALESAMELAEVLADKRTGWQRMRLDRHHARPGRMVEGQRLDLEPLKPDWGRMVSSTFLELAASLRRDERREVMDALADLTGANVKGRKSARAAVEADFQQQTDGELNSRRCAAYLNTLIMDLPYGRKMLKNLWHEE
ncbi:MAG: hypothetical protein GF416_05615 [Candidatus Altiarchaeales archaeon]|nr:hypothetical protein [Candidatus Altiarchaeales archaeon]MBD3416592.1 hypothetical protein [Candidatus Altiarchaeales archaeon]